VIQDKCGKAKISNGVKAIFGLGNPGFKYINNRHNIGYKIVEKLADIQNVKFKRSFKTGALIAEKEIGAEVVLFIKPGTFMNNSGLCVKKALKAYKLSIEGILMVYDEVDLPLGVIRFKQKGSCAGHRGMASTIAFLGTQEISRLRIGVGRPEGAELSDYVLSDFSSKEEKVLKTVIEKAAAVCIDWVEK